MTAQQKRAYDFIVAYWNEHGQAPLRREIAAHLGNRNHGGVNAMLERMAERGWVSFAGGVRNVYPLAA